MVPHSATHAHQARSRTRNQQSTRAKRVQRWTHYAISGAMPALARASSTNWTAYQQNGVHGERVQRAAAKVRSNERVLQRHRRHVRCQGVLGATKVGVSARGRAQRLIWLRSRRATKDLALSTASCTTGAPGLHAPSRALQMQAAVDRARHTALALSEYALLMVASLVRTGTRQGRAMYGAADCPSVTATISSAV